VSDAVRLGQLSSYLVHEACVERRLVRLVGIQLLLEAGKGVRLSNEVLVEDLLGAPT
jgi:hypothetical protein